jgi:mannose-6-phosphate isomerase
VTYLLDNVVRSYAWGSATVIPELLGVEPTGEPQAELWIGAHPGSPSVARTDSGSVTLDELVGKNPERMLGASVLARFGPRLPFLLKVLAIERPLSIQTHPSSSQAEEGYDAEDAAGIPLDAPDRSYRDRFPKPEIVVALSDFEALLGFRSPTVAADLLGQLGVAGLSGVIRALTGPDGLARAVQRILTLEPASTQALATEVAAACAERRYLSPFATIADIGEIYPGDRGVLLALLLEPMHLSPGEACFVPAGTPHAYLRGVVVEAQGSSDNTLRAGLTPKHVDVAEVLRLFRYEPSVGLRLEPVRSPDVETFDVSGVAEFRLRRVRLDGRPVVVAHPGPRIVLVTDGKARLTVGTQTMPLARGASAFVPAEHERIALSGTGTAFVVTTVVNDLSEAR